MNSANTGRLRIVGEAEASRPAVSLRGVSISYPLKAGLRYDALAPVSFDVDEGEFTAIVGPTGCGKSTLLNAVAGLVKPATGQVDIFGKPLEGVNKQSGYLFQADALMPWKTVLENAAIGLEVAGMVKSEARAKAGALLTKVGLKSFIDRYPHQLSGGQRKRVALAQMLVRDPKILLMDEPFGPLDAQTRLIMGELLIDLWQADRKAALFVTHDLDEAITLADRVIILSAGPSARVIGDFRIDIPRPRIVSDVRAERRFHELHAAIWGLLRDEVRKAYAQIEG